MRPRFKTTAEEVTIKSTQPISWGRCDTRTVWLHEVSSQDGVCHSGPECITTGLSLLTLSLQGLFSNGPGKPLFYPLPLPQSTLLTQQPGAGPSLSFNQSQIKPQPDPPPPLQAAVLREMNTCPAVPSEVYLESCCYPWPTGAPGICLLTVQKGSHPNTAGLCGTWWTQHAELSF